MDRLGRSVVCGIAIASAASLWHAIESAEGVQPVVWPAPAWWAGQLLRGPGFLFELYGAAGGHVAVLAPICWVWNACFYSLAAATAFASSRVLRGGVFPVWLGYALPAVILGLNVYEQEVTWIADAGSDLLSRPPIAVYLNLVVALPALVVLLPFAGDGFGPGEMAALDLTSAILYGLLAQLTLAHRRPTLLIGFGAIALGTIALASVVLWWTS